MAGHGCSLKTPCGIKIAIAGMKAMMLMIRRVRSDSEIEDSLALEGMAQDVNRRSH